MKLENIKNLINEFISYKHSLGYKYITEERQMQYFFLYLKNLNLLEIEINEKTILPFISQRETEVLRSKNVRHNLIRQFLIFLRDKGLNNYVLSSIYEKKSSYIPYIFSHEEIKKLFSSFSEFKLTNTYFKSKNNYPVLFKLLYSTGIRISEALNIKLESINLDKGTIEILSSKFNNSRIIVISDSMQIILSQFIENNHQNSPHGTYLFRNGVNNKLIYGSIHNFFKRALIKSKIPYLGRGKGPRLHDLRHTFCCHSLRKMSDEGIDLYVSLPILSAYIGHKSIKVTERYIRLTEEFFSNILKKTEEIAEKIFPEVIKYESD